MPQQSVLVVDLDGTLVRSDTLHEALLSHAAADPLGALRALIRLGEGKAAFKRHLADRRTVAPSSLPITGDVLALVRAARAEGRRTALVSAADQRQVDRVAEELGLFDEAHGTGGPAAGPQNLSGVAKAAFLTARYGDAGFDYVGDSHVDLPVWEKAAGGATIGASPRLRRAAEAVNPHLSHLAPPLAGLAEVAPYVRALRPHQWAKNVLVFMPMLAAHDLSGITAALVAFLAFSLTASSVYILNDLLDLEADRAHPRKRLRPFAAAEIPILHGLVMASALALAAFTVALLFTPALFVGVLAVYYVATFAYSLVLKRKLIVDILTLAGLYTLRILGGAAATAVTLSPWMLAFSMFLFLSLAAVKRQAELTDQRRTGKRQTPGRGYRASDLPVMRGVALSAGNATVLVFALYVSSPKVVGLYRTPEALWLVCPLLLYWLTRMVMVAHRGDMSDDPIVFAAADRVSQLVVATAGVVVIAGALI